VYIRQRFAREFERKCFLGDASLAKVKEIRAWSEDLASLSKDVLSKRKDSRTLEKKFRSAPDGRYLTFEAHAYLHPEGSKLHNNSRVHLWFGYVLRKKGKSDIGMSMEGGIYCDEIGFSSWRERHYGKSFPKEETAWRDICKFLNEVRTEALREIKSGPQRKALHQLTIPRSVHKS